MFASALIVFREVLEAALIVSIVMAATRGVAGRGRWVAAGIGGGIAAAVIVALFMNAIAQSFEGVGQEMLNAAILFAAVAMIGWHVVWMNSHGRVLAQRMRAVGQSVSEGEAHMSVLAIVVGLATMREGAEIVLMMQGLLQGADAALLLGGALFGLVGGVALGLLIYAGFLALSLSRLFALTNALLLLIAAGMAARGANYLAQADILPALGTRLWDTSGFLSEDSLVGQTLGTLVGYVARPSGIEVLSYAATLLVAVALLLLTRQRQMMTAKMAAAVAVCLLAAAPVQAASVKSPYVELYELELEQKGKVTDDNIASKDSEVEAEFSIYFSPFSFWKTEFETEFKRSGGVGKELKVHAYKWGNTFPLAEPGEYWFDPALYFEWEFTQDGGADAVNFGLLGAKDIGKITTTANLIYKKTYGPGNVAGQFRYRNQTKYRLRPWFQPGFELYGDTNRKSRFAEQKLAIGPGIFGKLPGFTDRQGFKYEAAWLVGATRGAPDGEFRWKLEYEYHF